jgi:hypothetical protein
MTKLISLSNVSYAATTTTTNRAAVALIRDINSDAFTLNIMEAKAFAKRQGVDTISAIFIKVARYIYADTTTGKYDQKEHYALAITKAADMVGADFAELAVAASADVKASLGYMPFEVDGSIYDGVMPSPGALVVALVELAELFDITLELKAHKINKAAWAEEAAATKAALEAALVDRATEEEAALAAYLADDDED